MRLSSFSPKIGVTVPELLDAGEDALDDALQKRFGRRFRHNEQSLRIARSLNLTHEVCDGIREFLS